VTVTAQHIQVENYFSMQLPTSTYLRNAMNRN